jgi:hypothetical protein
MIVPEGRKHWLWISSRQFANLGDALRGVGEVDGAGERVFFTATGGG